MSLGRLDEVTLADAREAAQTHRAKAKLGETTPKRLANDDLTLRRFLDEHYEPWMSATHHGRTGQVARIRWAFVALAAYFTWKGTNLEGKGVAPDVEQPLWADVLGLGDDNQLQRAQAQLTSISS